ncbi:MAG: family 2 glycosyl transferase [Draconibacterium sp.]|nr:MAG: family 2 glycosyl transferase [Draconibacterium sp.]
MPDAVVITPVKDSLNTVKQTISSVANSVANIAYFVFNDFSGQETRNFLEEAKSKYQFTLIHLEDHTNTPSPNYNLILRMAQKEAIKEKCPLIIIESDVIVKPDTISELLQIARLRPDCGIVGAITTDSDGNYNFPYTFEKEKSNKTINTNHSISFCCTLIEIRFLQAFNFNELSEKKDWYDVFVSRQSKKLGYSNYLAKGIEVLHLPHSSRPWKNLKYSNPFLYYIKKLLFKRDRI